MKCRQSADNVFFLCSFRWQGICRIEIRTIENDIRYVEMDFQYFRIRLSKQFRPYFDDGKEISVDPIEDKQQKKCLHLSLVFGAVVHQVVISQIFHQASERDKYGEGRKLCHTWNVCARRERKAYHNHSNLIVNHPLGFRCRNRKRKSKLNVHMWRFNIRQEHIFDTHGEITSVH